MDRAAADAGDEARKARAAAWFEALRDRICAAFEGIEDAQDAGPFAGLPPGRFARQATRREAEADADADGGGGVMAVMREGRVFEKVGVNVSTVHGRLDERAQQSLTARKEIRRARRRPALLGERNQPRRAHALAADPGRAHEHPHVLDAARQLVRRRVRPQPGDRGRGGHRLLPRRAPARLRRARPRLLPAVQGLGRRLFPDPASERAARRRRHLLRRPRDRRLGGGLRLRPRRRRGVPRSLRADHRTAHAPARGPRSSARPSS